MESNNPEQGFPSPVGDFGFQPSTALKPTWPRPFA